MKASLTTLKSILIANAVLLSLLLLKPLFATPAQAQPIRVLGASGTYQVAISDASVTILDTRDGTLKIISNGKVTTAHRETDYKEIFQAK